jgi:iron complex outermembrane receptor protein
VLAAVSTTPVVPQRDFYDGTFRSSEWSTNLDVVKNIDAGMVKPLVLAFGAEYRLDKFTIVSGEPSSYYGAGAQSFTGYDPSNAGTHSRHDYAFYVDLAADPIEKLHVDLAARYEDYSDFGSATVGKLTGRYDFNPVFAIRGTISNGFRAPTLQEEFYSGTNVSPSSATVQLPADSEPAVIAGFHPLKPEKANNYSFGFVAHPTDGLQITLDAYQIDVSDRIQTTGFLYGSVVVGGHNVIISQAVLDAIAAHGNTLDSGISYAGISVFTNAVDTRTQGLEATVTYASDFASYGHVDWNLGLNYNKTSITKLAPLPPQLFSAAPNIITQTTLLSPSALSGLTTASPREKMVGNAYWTLGKWSVNLRETIYGESSELTSTSNVTTNLKIPVAGITDLNVSYRFTNWVKVDVGANNLFDKMPPNVPNLAALNKPASGGNVWNAPMTFSPYGINGGYYYARVTLTY